MNHKLTQSLLDAYMSKVISRKNIHGAVICVENGSGALSFTSSAGNIQPSDFYFLASVTKLYVTAVMLRLRAQNRLRLEDKISRYLPTDMTSGLHVYKGIDYTQAITIKHLMSNTSGLPDYFSNDVFSEFLSGKDQAWSLEKTLTLIKQKKPRFMPGQKGKAQYSDTNYQLLGIIIEAVTGTSVKDVFKQFIFDELGLEETYVFEDVNDSRPVPLYYKSKPLHLPCYMASIASEGGIVATAKDTMTFLKAFFNGHFFSRQELSELQKNWNLLFLPGTFYYGVGISRQPLSLRGLKKGLLGHWGQSGAFAFHDPEKDLYFTGTVNEVTGHSAAARLMNKIKKSA
ncbi:CubicO group peptidase (beta-lactamase class C family) [Bacillus thermophilus]|uniref:CubicO group peptidase (Beta-lactamase class C family) n=1 Tax=Siminovitchia thermophila TaxID=1245522 RepID=A0ABS2R1Z4_9BACI|nr:serine hydrolase domain-containing protein [Siminovitchia thermophila]MBM7713385.1 CubicO group peptidase (beta-lactamase class C family) [Siminovitchia thermophila]